LLALNCEAPEVDGVEAIALSTEGAPELAARYLGEAGAALYLMRPDQHVAARWTQATPAAIAAAKTRAMGD